MAAQPAPLAAQPALTAAPTDAPVIQTKMPPRDGTEKQIVAYLPVYRDDQFGHHIDSHGMWNDVPVKLRKPRGCQGSGSAQRHQEHNQRAELAAERRRQAAFGAAGPQAAPTRPPAVSINVGPKAAPTGPPAVSINVGSGGSAGAPRTAPAVSFGGAGDEGGWRNSSAAWGGKSWGRASGSWEPWVGSQNAAGQAAAPAPACGGGSPAKPRESCADESV